MWKASANTSLALGALALVTAALAPNPAHACGGLFCSVSPVDQNAERILFEVHDTNHVTATVEISYAGDPGSFSWIVPVPETPSEMDVAPASALRLLDQATAPIIIPPPTTCSQSDFRFSPFPASAVQEDAATAENGGVVVEDLPAVGPYDPEVVSSDDPEALIEWLEDNDYLITDEMKPFIASYSQDGFKFLGVKLLPDAGVSDISPLRFTCPSPDGTPLIPLKLTAVASEPEMGILAWVAGAERFSPLNYRQVTVDTDLVQFDPRLNQSNYYPLVSWLVDQEGGKAFVTEYAGPTDENLQNAVNNVFLPTNDFEEARTWLLEKLEAHPYITRMYTRMSGWEMDDDPVFAAGGGSDVSNVHDLSDRPAIEICGEIDRSSVPCGNTYCGEGSRCAVTEDGEAGCVCNSGSLARAITVPRGRGLPLGGSVTCQDASLDLLQSAVDQIGDPCDGFGCGEGGQCVPVNGFATCECDAGFVAVQDFVQPGGLQCRPVSRVFAPDQLLWPDGIPSGAQCTCFEASPRGAVAGALAIFALLGFVGTRRRRR
jgi:hypothetical protein